MSHWNPRFELYAEMHNRTPDAMLAFDAERYPGGRMAGYITWIDERWRDYARAKGLSRDLASLDQAAFDAWLRETESSKPGP